MFYGVYRHKLNSRNQLTIPSRFREAIDEERDGKGFYLFRDERDPYLHLYTPAEMRRVVEAARAGSLGRDQDFLRLFFSRFTPVECDPQGRIVIPAEIKDAAGLAQEVVVVGASRRIEIWSAPEWDAYETARKQAYEEKLGHVAEGIFGL